jgi:hypothetical protein
MGRGRLDLGVENEYLWSMAGEVPGGEIKITFKQKTDYVRKQQFY